MSATPESRAGQTMQIHRVGALAVAVVIGVFGVLGLAGGLGYFSTTGDMVSGMSSNGLLATISLLTAALLIGAAIHGGKLASTVMLVVGVAFLVSAFVNLAVLDTRFNFLAFRLVNVFFSIGVGLLLLLLGAYGRVSSHLPHNNPYYQNRHPEGDVSDLEPEPAETTPAEAAADLEMAEAERTVAGGRLGIAPTAKQKERVKAMSQVASHEDRRRVWMSYDR